MQISCSSLNGEWKYIVGHPLSHNVLFCFQSSSYQLGCTVAAVSAQRPVELVKNND